MMCALFALCANAGHVTVHGDVVNAIVLASAPCGETEPDGDEGGEDEPTDEDMGIHECAFRCLESLMYTETHSRNRGKEKTTQTGVRSDGATHINDGMSIEWF
jgi:hypothetical protein